MFGPFQTPKLHRILAHVLDELRLRGNLRAGDTGVNEAKHKGVKSAYTRTNRGRSEHALQLLMAEQVADVLNWAVADSEDVTTEESIARNGRKAAAGLAASQAASTSPAAPDVADGGRSMPSVVAAAAAGHEDALRLRRPGAPVGMGVLQDERELEGLAQCLELGNSDVVTVSDGSYPKRGAAPRRGGQRRHTLRTSQTYLGAPWLDCTERTSAHGVLRVGRARVVVTGVGKRPVRPLVVERARSVAAVAGCPFGAYRCTRLRFDVRDVGVTPVLECVPVSRVLRVLCVEHAWVDWVERHGLEDMPIAVPATREEVRRARFSMNAFLNM